MAVWDGEGEDGAAIGVDLFYLAEEESRRSKMSGALWMRCRREEQGKKKWKIKAKVKLFIWSQFVYINLNLVP